MLKSIKQLLGANVGIFSPDDVDWDVSKGVISNFQSYERATELLQSIGLNSVPTWVKPYIVLSQGEQYRATFARLLDIALDKAEKNPNYMIALDEFTSVLDRVTARCMSASINKYIRLKKKEGVRLAPFILVSANSDIIQYLQPSLVISLGTRAGDGSAAGVGECEHLMKLLHNPNNVKAPNVKVVIDPQLLKKPAAKEMNRIWGDPKSEKSFVVHCTVRLFVCVCFCCVLHVSDFVFLVLDTVLCCVTPIIEDVRELACRVETDVITQQASKVFDYLFNGACLTRLPFLELEDKLGSVLECYKIGIFVGPSGSGKTTTAQIHFGSPTTFEYSHENTIFSYFDNLKEAEECMTAAALDTRLGLQSFYDLSEGERERATIARALAKLKSVEEKEETLCKVMIDEFTSYLDRHTAAKVVRGMAEYVVRNKCSGCVLPSFLVLFTSVIECFLESRHSGWV